LCIFSSWYGFASHIRTGEDYKQFPSEPIAFPDCDKGKSISRIFRLKTALRTLRGSVWSAYKLGYKLHLSVRACDRLNGNTMSFGSSVVCLTLTLDCNDVCEGISTLLN